MSKEVKPKVLICTPTSNYKDYCLKDWAKSIKSLTYDADLLIIDNSHDESHVNEFRKYDFGRPTYIAYLSPKGDKDIRYTMCRCNNYALNFAIENGYDYMMSIESDVFAPTKNAIEILLSHKKDVVGFSYFISKWHNSIPIIEGRFRIGNRFCFDYLSVNCMEQFYKFKGQLMEVPNLGLGFVLINLKNVFSKIPNFRIVEKMFITQKQTDMIHADTFFYSDLASVGINAYCDTRYVCEHKNQNWLKVWEKEAEIRKN